MWFKYNQIFQLSEKDFWNVTLQGWCGWRQKMAKLKWSWVFWLNITLLKLPSKHCLLPSLSESGAVQFTLYSFKQSAVQTFAQSATFYRGTLSVQILELSCTLVWNTCTAQQHSISRVLVPLLPNPRVSPRGSLLLLLPACTLCIPQCTYFSATQDSTLESTVHHSATQSNTVQQIAQNSVQPRTP